MYEKVSDTFVIKQYYSKTFAKYIHYYFLKCANIFFFVQPSSEYIVIFSKICNEDLIVLRCHYYLAGTICSPPG